MSQLAEIKNLAGYLTAFGKTLGRKAIHSLSPLHVPGRDPLPDFSYIPEHRQPFEAQAHLINGGVKGMDKNGACFLIAEPGTGKTLCSIVATHEHACRPRRKGGMGGKYRAIVVCPDHLITKWKNEIEDTIPGAIVHCWRPKGDEGTGLTLRHWSDFLNLMRLGYSETKVRAGEQPTDVHEASISTGAGPHVNDKGELIDQPYQFEERAVRPRAISGKVVQHRLRWAKPVGPEWIIVGRDQIKRQSQTSGLGQPRRCFDRRVRDWEPSHTVVTDRKPITDGYGDQIVVNGIVQTKAVTEKRMQCPRCGTVPTRKGVPLGPEALDKGDGKHCEAMILEEIGSPDGKCSGRDRLTGMALPYEHRNAKDGQTVKHAGKSWRVRICGEPLYQYTRKPYWWPPALLIQRKLRGLYQYIVIDEVHEEKEAESQQSLAMAKILGNSQYALALTGTFIGGYASHLFPLLIRLAARDMSARNLGWDDMKEFIERYGCNDRVEITETTVESEGKKRGVRGGSQKRSSTKVTYKCRPGIMPTLFSEIVMPLAMFLKLDQFIDDLPGFEQKMIACELPAEIQQAYDQLQTWLVEANRELIANGLPKLLGTMLWTLLSYPDFPWEWEYMFPYEGREATPKFWENGRPVFSDGAPEHAIGWWYVPKVWTRENYVGVCTPKNFDKSIILPKERELINLCKTNAEAGDQTWVYCEMTGKRDVMARLARLLEEDGLRVGVLRSGDVSPKERDVWIQRNGHLYDVMLSHPQLVATGLDLFNLAHGNYNFNHLVFYQTGYNLFRLRQAERRAWRIGQPKDCTVTYLYYKATSQATALALMGRKAQAAQTLEEGTISDEGLAAMGGDAGAQAALVKALGDFIDPAEIQRNWSRVSGRGGAKRKPRPVRPSAISLPVPDELYEEERIPPPGVPSPLDSLPIKAQIVGETMLKARNANSPDEALADFRAWLAEEAAKLEEKPAVKVFDPEPEPEPVQAVEDWRCPRCGGDKSCPSAGPGAACHKTRHQAEQEWRERDQPKPKWLEDYSRDQLAAIFDAMRAGTLKNDDWDW